MPANRRAIFAALLAACLVALASRAAAGENEVRTVVARAVRPVMKQYGIPGMAVGVTLRGRHFVFTYGVASKATGKPVDDATLFEIGSITKTFTASLVAYAQLSGKLALSDRVGADVPALRTASAGRVRLVNLGTHTAGNFPLQFPDDVKNDDDALTYYGRWKPSHPAGTYRLYSNPGVMLLGLSAAETMHAKFATLMQREVFAPLGLHNTFLAVPGDRFSSYAQGYTDADEPRRLSPGPLAAEAYGIRTTAPDMLRFIDANMNLVELDATLRRAIVETHSGFYQLGAMTQDLIWEQYGYPVSLAVLLRGNSDDIVFEEHPVRTIDPPSGPRSGVWINKTGSTSGFAAYVAFVPRQTIGIVLLANKAYPIEARVTAAYRIVKGLR